jgi:oxygen-dependent protoporphyrinogen oxidase
LQEKKQVLVIGGGFSGLIQAFYLAEAGHPVRLLEKEDRLGGLLGSQQHDDFLFEQAANAMIANRELERVGKIIGVRWVQKKKQAGRRYIYRQGQMRRWPLGIAESLPLVPFLWHKKWRNSKAQPREDETLEVWGQRHLGPALTHYLLEPAMQGVYAAPLHDLDASLILKSLRYKPKRGRLRGSVAPSGGMQEWIDRMVDYLRHRNVEIQTGTEVSDFSWDRPTILALGLSALQQLVNRQRVPLPSSILEAQCVSLTSVCLAFTETAERLPEGFGCLFPKSEKLNSMGVLFNHSIFPGRAERGASETWILGDQTMSFSRMSERALLRYVLSDRHVLRGATTDPTHWQVNQWPGRIPLYNRALKTFLSDLDQQRLPFLLIGNYLGDLGLSKILFHAKNNLLRIESREVG